MGGLSGSVNETFALATPCASSVPRFSLPFSLDHWGAYTVAFSLEAVQSVQ